jgi:hypothetical protein
MARNAAALALAVLFSACGRAFPEGYVPVKLALKGAADSPGRSGGDYRLLTTCEIPFLRLTALNFIKIANPSVPLTAQFDSSAFGSQAGTTVFEAAPAVLPVKAGTAHRFVVEGVVGEACSGSAGAPLFILGASDVIDLAKNPSLASVNMTAKVASETFLYLSSSQVVPPTHFVAHNVTWEGSPGYSGTDSVYLKVVGQNATLTFTISGTSASVLNQSHVIGPLLPSRLYQLIYRKGSLCTAPAEATTAQSQALATGPPAFRPVAVFDQACPL